MTIWKYRADLLALNQLISKSMPGHLGIEIVEIGDDYLKATMPVDHRTHQPLGLLHGGASAALSETLGSIASMMTISDPTQQSAVGVEINANHLRSAREGVVYAVTKPIKIGKRLQVWNTDIYDHHEQLLCTSRLTTMIVESMS